MAVTKGTDGSVYIILTSTVFAGEATTEDAATAIYQIDDVAKRVWDPNVAIVLSTGTIDQNWMNGGVDWFTGRVKATSSGLAALTISGASVTLQTVAEVFGWSINLVRGSENTQNIGETWEDPTDLGESATVTLSRFRIDTNVDALSGAYLLLKLYENSTTGFWVKALRTSLNLTKAVGQVDKDSIEFAASGPVARI